MKIQFVVVGWYYNQDTLQEGLKSLNDNNDEINVFYSCHKEPTQYIKDNFDWKLFPNLGEEIVAYQQALEDMRNWNSTYPMYPILVTDIDYKAVIKRKMQKHKKRADV